MKISNSTRRRKGRGRERRSRRRLDWEAVWLVLVVVMVVGPLSVPPNLRHWALPDQQRRKPSRPVQKKCMYNNSNHNNHNNRSLSGLCTVSGTRR